MHPLRLGIKAQRLKRVFGIDMQTCKCGGTIKVIACIEDPALIKQILDHLDKRKAQTQQAFKHKPHTSRVPPIHGEPKQLKLGLDG